MKKWLPLFLLSYSLIAQETVVESNTAHYDGERITLKGDVTIENAMGRVTSNLAILKKDEAKRTKIDFPWIELKEGVCLTLTQGGVVHCETLYVDYTQMTSLLIGNPQVSYSDAIGEIYADKARIDYQEIEGKLEATQITLFDNVRLVNLGSGQQPTSQYALADEVSYFPQAHFMLLEGRKSRVLFYDTQHDMQLSARTIRAQRDPVTKKESVQGVGDVRFVFGPEELERIKGRFQIKP